MNGNWRHSEIKLFSMRIYTIITRAAMLGYNVIANRICQLDIMIHKYIIRWNIRKSVVNIGGTRNVRI